jgi:hypothetical protein
LAHHLRWHSELVHLLPLAAAIAVPRPSLQPPQLEQLVASAFAPMLSLLAALGRRHVGLRLLLCRVALQLAERWPGGQQQVLANARQLGHWPSFRAGLLELTLQLQEDAGIMAAVEAWPAARALAGWATWRSSSLALCALLFHQAQPLSGPTLAEVRRGQLHRLLAAGLQEAGPGAGAGTGPGGAPAAAHGPGDADLRSTRIHGVALLRMLAFTIMRAHASAPPAPGPAAEPPPAALGTPPPAAGAGAQGLAHRPGGLSGPETRGARCPASLLSPAQLLPPALGAATPRALPPQRPGRGPAAAAPPAAAARRPLGAGASSGDGPAPAVSAGQLYAALMRAAPAPSGTPAAQPAAAPTAAATPAAAAAASTPTSALQPAQQLPQPQHKAAAQQEAQEAWELYRQPLLLFFRVSCCRSAPPTAPPAALAPASHAGRLSPGARRARLDGARL